MTRDYDVWLADFRTEMLAVAGVKTAVYVAPELGAKPVVLFVHGINGDYHGMVPVAYLLRDVCRAVFVDMPGHGASELPLDDDILTLVHAWAQALPEVLREASLDVVAAAGHSFGSYIVQETGLRAIALLNPPFGATNLSKRGTAVLGYAPSVVAKAYQSHVAMIQRGHWLMHTRTPASDEIIAWSSALTHVTKEQFKFQARLSDVVAPLQLMDTGALGNVTRLLIVMSEYDRIVDNSTAPLGELPNAVTVTLPTDHVSIFEMPERIADEIKQLLAV